MKKIKNILISACLSICMLVGSLPVELLAQEELVSESEIISEEESVLEIEQAESESDGAQEGRIYIIEAFEALSREIEEQTVLPGTSIESLLLPSELSAVCYLETNEAEENTEDETGDNEDVKPGEIPDEGEKEDENPDTEGEMGEDENSDAEDEPDSGDKDNETDAPQGDAGDGKDEETVEDEPDSEFVDDEGTDSDNTQENENSGIPESGGETGNENNHEAASAGAAEGENSNTTVTVGESESGNGDATVSIGETAERKNENVEEAEGNLSGSNVKAKFEDESKSRFIKYVEIITEDTASNINKDGENNTVKDGGTETDADNRETDNGDADNRETDNGETDNRETDNRETDNGETDNRETDNSGTDNHETDNYETDVDNNGINADYNESEGSENTESDDEYPDGNNTEAENNKETIIIDGITWISLPEYDGETAGIYVFTPVIPQGYCLNEGVELPEITVIVSEEEIELTEEEPTEDIRSLPECGTISEDTEWGSGTLRNGILNINEGITLTITGVITVKGNIVISGGGKIARGGAGAYISLFADSSLTLKDVTIDGMSLEAPGSMIQAASSKLQLDEGCVIQNCVSTSKGGAIRLSEESFLLCKGPIIRNCAVNSESTSNGGGAIYCESSNITIEDALIENCYTNVRGGAILSIQLADAAKPEITINGGIFRNNKTTSTDSIDELVGGGFIYTCRTELTINGGSFIGNTAANKGGCIYHCGHEGTATYLKGGYFENNSCTYPKYRGSGAVYNSTVATGKTDLYLSGSINLVGNSNEALGVDGIMLDQKNDTPRKIWINDEFSYPITIYVKAIEDYVIAEGWNYTILENRDMKKIKFVNIDDEATPWYPVLDKTTNQVKLSTTPPEYLEKYYVTYIKNGAVGNTVKDNNNNDNGYDAGSTTIIQPAGDLSFGDGYYFWEWNTKADGSGIGYKPGNVLTITGDIDLYAIFTQNTADYKVEHYKQNLNNDGYTKVEADTQNLRGAININVTAVPKNYPGFTENRTHPQAERSGIVKEDGSLVLKLYYDRNIYKVGFDLNYDNEGDNSVIAPPLQTLYGGEKLSRVTEPGRRGYTFTGWYKSKASADEGINASLWDYNENVENNISSSESSVVTLYAGWVDDIAPVLGEASYNTGYKSLAGWIIRKKDLIISVPVTEEGSGVDTAEYTLISENGDIITGETQIEAAYIPRQVRRNESVQGNETAVYGAAGTNGARAGQASSIQFNTDNGRVSAVITISEEYKGSVTLKCSDKAGNISLTKRLTVADGGIIVEDNAPEISFLSGKIIDKKVNIRVTVTDEADKDGNAYLTGGIASVAYQIDSKEPYFVNDKDFEKDIVTSCVFNVEVSGTGEHILSVTALDNAGNESVKRINVNIPRGKNTTVIKTNNPVTENNNPPDEQATEFVRFVQSAAPFAPAAPLNDSEPDTGDTYVQIEVYATVAMIAGLLYLLLYFSTGKNGMSEEEKNKAVSKLINWAKKGRKYRRFIAIMAIFCVLFYYHSIGRRVALKWNEIYEK